MTRKLNQSDRQAVDLVMDRYTTPRGEVGVIPVTGAPAEPHVEAVEKILQVLSNMPAEEPAPDLVTRTLRRIEQAAPQTEPRQIPPYLGPGQMPA